MLVDLYPRVHRRYSSLAVIGPILDGYGTWLLKQGYSTERAREHFRAAPRLVRGLEQHGVQVLTGLTRARLWACAPADSQEDPNWVRLFFVGGPRGFLRAAREELLDASKAWWGGWRVRLADRWCCPISVSLGVVALVLARFVEVPVCIEVAAGS